MVYIALALAAVLALADQMIKWLIVDTVKINGGFSLLGGLVKILYSQNDGIAFGLMGGWRWVFTIATGVILLIIAIYLLVKKPRSKLMLTACALIIGGGIGNLIDRIFNGYVIDYIQLSFFPPVCNFADYCVTIGTALLMIYLFFFSTYLKDDKKIKAAE